jgi:hypothetical protein
LTEAGFFTNHKAEHLTLTTSNVSARKDQWGWKFVSAAHLVGIVHLSLLTLLFRESHLADSKDFLLHHVRLTSHGSLINTKLGGLEDDTVNWVGHTVLNVDDITDMQVVVVDLLNCTFAEHAADVLFVGLCTRFNELNLLLPVDKGAD